MDDLNRFFSGRGKALKFETVGTTHTLRITGEATLEQQTDFDDGSPLVWPDGSPKMQALIPGIVEEGLTGPSDEGERTLYVKGYMQNALSKALRDAGVRKPEPGGVLTITYSHDGEKKGRGKPPKMYKATYQPPTKAASEDFFSGGQTEVPAQRARAAAKAAATAAGGNDEEPPF